MSLKLYLLNRVFGTRRRYEWGWEHQARLLVGTCVFAGGAGSEMSLNLNWATLFNTLGFFH